MKFGIVMVLCSKKTLCRNASLWNTWRRVHLSLLRLSWTWRWLFCFSEWQTTLLKLTCGFTNQDNRNSKRRTLFEVIKKVKVKWSHYRPGVTQRVGRGIALLFHGRDTRRGWVVSSTPRPHFTPGKDPLPILQEAGWAPGPVWRGGKSRPHRDSIPYRPARSSVAIPTELPGPHSKQ